MLTAQHPAEAPANVRHAADRPPSIKATNTKPALTRRRSLSDLAVEFIRERKAADAVIAGYDGDFPDDKRHPAARRHDRHWRRSRVLIQQCAATPARNYRELSSKSTALLVEIGRDRPSDVLVNIHGAELAASIAADAQRLAAKPVDWDLFALLERHRKAMCARGAAKRALNQLLAQHPGISERLPTIVVRDRAGRNHTIRSSNDVDRIVIKALQPELHAAKLKELEEAYEQRTKNRRKAGLIAAENKFYDRRAVARSLVFKILSITPKTLEGASAQAAVVLSALAELGPRPNSQKLGSLEAEKDWGCKRNWILYEDGLRFLHRIAEADARR